MKKENMLKCRKWLLMLLSTMILLLAPASNSFALDASSRYVASTASAYAGHTYQLIFEKMSWEDADVYARSAGGHLATITSVGEQNFVWNLIQDWRNIYTECYWIGATDQEQEGVWRWTTGESFEYAYWNPEQPDDRDGEDCLEIGRYDDGTWNDARPKDYPIGFIVEWEGSNAGIRPIIVSIRLNKSEAEIKVGAQIKLKAAVTGKKKAVTWKSSNPKVAEVSPSGKVTAKKAGTAVITARANGVSAKCKVTVRKEESKGKKAALAAYRKLLSKSTIQVTLTAGSKFDLGTKNTCKFSLLYVDKDQVPELYLTGRSVNVLLTYANGKIKTVWDRSWGSDGFAYYKRTGVYSYTDYITGGYTSKEFCMLSKGATDVILGEDRDPRGSSSYSRKTYKNGKFTGNVENLSRTAFDQAFKKWVGNTKASTPVLHLATASNLSKYLK